MKQKNISKVMKILEREFPVSKTTLNKMRNEHAISGGLHKRNRLTGKGRENRRKPLRLSSKPNSFKILISCLLSLRTQDKNTEIASRRLFAVAKTPKQILALPTKKLEKLIYSSGHYKKKAKTLKHVSKVLIEKFNGKVPETREELMSIKGIGPKTANIVLAFAFGKKVLPIDTHCHRIPNRLGWIKTKTPEKTEEELNKILPKKYWAEFNSIFIQFGKTICQPISPKCSICPVNKYCKKIDVKKWR